MDFFTIGVYNSTENEFFEKLTKHQIDTFCDIRQRRGVRGAKYAFVNSVRLQDKLNELGINYIHFIDLAPTTEIREKQKLADHQNKELKSERLVLGNIFIQEYKKLIIENFDFEDFIGKLNSIGANRVVLFCVEENPKACHRSLVTDELAKRAYKITHL